MNIMKSRFNVDLLVGIIRDQALSLFVKFFTRNQKDWERRRILEGSKDRKGKKEN